MYGYLRDAYRDVELFRIILFRFEQLLMQMANEGEWRQAFEFLGEAISRQTGIRDYIAGEKVIQGFLAAYLSLADYYVLRSEAELGKGHADIALEPLVARYPHLQRGYLIELKYRARSESADQAAVTTVVEEAQAQLRRYLADERLARQFPGVSFIGLIVVFHGWELVYCDACSADHTPIALVAPFGDHVLVCSQRQQPRERPPRRNAASPGRVDRRRVTRLPTPLTRVHAYMTVHL